MPWTRFHDMHSGGSLKTPYHFIYIEAPIEDATVYLGKRFGIDPDHVTCRCCGSDFSVMEENNLREASAYERGCNVKGDEWIEEPRFWDHPDSYRTLQEMVQTNMVNLFGRDERVLIVFAHEMETLND
jgi:hypothetical protein